MKKMKNCAVVATVLMLGLLTACDKKEDELVLVTTEAVATEATQEVTTEEITEELTEEATGGDKSISYQDMYDANKGDVLLASGESYSINTIFYSNGKESYSEFQFLGFDDRGMYTQIYEDSDGYVEILDAANNYWYVVKDNKLSVLIYPEPLAAAAIIDSNHNSMIFELSGREEGTETVEAVYRKDGKLCVDTVYGETKSDQLKMKYILQDNWIVQEYGCYDIKGELLSYAKVTQGATYDIPKIVADAMAMEEGYRTINFTYVDGDQLDMTYYTAVDVPVELELIEYIAYSDEQCTTVWSEIEADENGVYKDVTIYMKKNSKDGASQ